MTSWISLHRCFPDISPFIQTWVMLTQEVACQQKLAPVSCCTTIKTLSQKCAPKAPTVGPSLGKGSPSIVVAGLAVYFYEDLLPQPDYKTVEENHSESSQMVCSVPVDSVVYEEPGWQHWLLQKLINVIKYLLFGAFVLTCNKLRRYIRVQRQRSSSTSSISTDSVDVSQWGRVGGDHIQSHCLQDDEFPLIDQLVNTIRRHSSLTESAGTGPTHTPSLPNSSTETLVSFSRANSYPEPRSLPNTHTREPSAYNASLQYII